MLTLAAEARMATLTIIVGMAGSGKSWLCDDIKKQRATPVYIFKDATLTNSDERRAGHECLGEMVARLVGRSEDCVMDEAHLTVPGFRQSFKSFCDTFLEGVDQKWIFYEANVLACINNLFHDAQSNGRVELSRYRALEAQRGIYKVPDEAAWPGRMVREVHRCEKPIFKASEEAQAVKWLQLEIARLQPRCGGW
jgi:hypothetical protein